MYLKILLKHTLTLLLLSSAAVYANSDEYIITFKNQQKKKEQPTLLFKNFGKNSTFKNFKHLNTLYAKVEEDNSEAFLNSLKANPLVESISKNHSVTLYSQVLPSYRQLWAVENVGQKVNGKREKVNADMDLKEAWQKSQGDKEVIVALLDTGVDYTHQSLVDNMWEGAVNHGYDFAGDNEGNNDNDPMPEKPYQSNRHYHGTHIAGIIAASGNNPELIGVAPKVSIMALKVFRPNGKGYISDILEAIDYILERVEMGDNIVAVNASYGTFVGNENDVMQMAIRKLKEKGILFCTASGNEGIDIDKKPIYPATYNEENIIVVGASTQDDKLANYSNFGEDSVDLLAPGSNILSSYPENQFKFLSGTSMATAQVSGTVALLASLYGNTTAMERKAMILNHVDKQDTFFKKVATAGRININKTLENGQSTFHYDASSYNLHLKPISFFSTLGTKVKLKLDEKKKLEIEINLENKTSNFFVKDEYDSVELTDNEELHLYFEKGNFKLNIDKQGILHCKGELCLKLPLPQNGFPLGTKANIDGGSMQYLFNLSETSKF